MSGNINLKIVDTTLREGLQAVHPAYSNKGVIFSQEQQLQIAKLLFEFGIDYVELITPVRSETGKNITKEIIKLSKNYNTKVLAHVRSVELDISEALSLGFDGLNMYFNASKYSKYTKEEKNEIIENSLKYAYKHSPNKEVRFSFEDAYRTSFTEIIEQTNKIQNYVKRVGMPDTVGSADPNKVHRRISEFRKLYPKIDIESHFHNDTGMAIANAYTAVKSGGVLIDTTILGIGERNGITSLSGLLAASHLDHELLDLIKSKYKLSVLKDLVHSVADFLEIKVPYNIPIVSPSAFSHTAGVHANTVNRNKQAYEFLSPEIFNMDTKIIWTSSVVGKASILYRAKQLGIELLPNVAAEIADKVREHARLTGEMENDDVDSMIITASKNGL